MPHSFIPSPFWGEGTHLDYLLVEAYALVREVAWRTIGLKAFDVQVVAGIVIHRGKLAEMSTGEGKTLVAVFPAFLNALSGKRRSYTYVQRLPGTKRRRLDGSDIRIFGNECGMYPGRYV